MPSDEKFKIALCQTTVDYDKSKSIANAQKALEEAAAKGAQLIVLGEMFGCPYATKYFREYGEAVPAPGDPAPTERSPTVRFLCSKAKELKVWIVGGTVPELCGDQVHNTSIAVNPEGVIVARHRKVHLFDIDVAATDKRPAIKFKESDVLTGGEKITVFDTPWCRVGLGICYDMRFCEQALAMRQQGAKLLIYPAAFNMTTGPAHWDIIARGRAVDTQSYVALCSPARSADPKDYQAWGHSMLVGPWGEIMEQADHRPGIWYAEVEPLEANRVREQIPMSKQRRTDLYELVDIRARGQEVPADKRRRVE